MEQDGSNRKGNGPKIIISLIILVGLIVVFFSYRQETVVAPTGTGTFSTGTSTGTSTSATDQATTTETYVNTAHDFQFQYSSAWKQTQIFNTGIYLNAIVFVEAAQENAIATAIGTSPNTSDLVKAAEGNALIFRIENETSINDIIANLYGYNVAVSNVTINGKNVAHVVHSASTDPSITGSISTEAYIFRNSLNEAIVLEANYATQEPATSGDLKNALTMTLNSLTIN